MTEPSHRGGFGDFGGASGGLIERTFRERIVLVASALPPHDDDDTERSLDELAQLVDTAGADEVARVVQRRDRHEPATYIGKGKAEELRELSDELDADTVVFDDELSPGQQFNLEKLLGRTALDRTAVILDIFAQNAHSQEGKAQVELAQLRYRLPRLRRAGGSFSQQGAGIGTRGPGETQLEVDRRRLVRRIHKLEAELRNIDPPPRHPAQGAAPVAASTPSPSSATPTPASRPCSTGSPRPACWSRTACSPPSTPPPAGSTCPAASRCWSPTPSGSSASCPTSWSRRSSRPSRWWPTPTCWCTWSTPRGPSPTTHIDAVRQVLDEIGAGQVPELLAFNKADLGPDGPPRLVGPPPRLGRRLGRAPARASTTCSAPSATGCGP